MIKPIKPSKIVEKKKELISDFMIEAINELLIKCWNYNTNISQIEQYDIVEYILLKEPTLKIKDIFNEKWPYIEDIYKAEGWDVEYVKPTYFENFTPYFIFKESKN